MQDSKESGEAPRPGFPLMKSLPGHSQKSVPPCQIAFVCEPSVWDFMP
jgi:hypothetical protein